MGEPLYQRRMKESMGRPEAPGVPNITTAQAADDLDPKNLQDIQRIMGHRDMKDPRQQAALEQALAGVR